MITTKEALEHLKKLEQFAYENGFHENGYVATEVIENNTAKMTSCVLFAINNFPNKIVINEDNSMTNLHSWFKSVLVEVGYELKEEKP